MVMDRLTAADLSMVTPEEFGWPQDIGAVMVLDGGGLVDSDGRLRIAAVREVIERRLHLVPRFRQLLVTPRRGLGWPLWVDASAFDIAEHVGVCPLAPPAGERQLLLATERLRRRPLERSRPLWEMWFLPGLPARRVGLFMKLHHAIADGVAGIALLGAFLDLDADPARQPAAPPSIPAPMPSNWDLFADNLHRHGQALGRAVSRAARPVDTARQLRRVWPAVRESFAEQRVSRTSLNSPVGSDRRLAVVRGDLAQAKRIGHAHGATVNDVLIAAIAGGLRELLSGRGEHVDELILRAFIPVSLHHEQPDRARANLDAAMFVPLPVGVPDSGRRLELIAADTAERKKKARPSGGALLPGRTVQRVALRLLARQRFMSVYAANVPGPPLPLYFAGARLLEVFPVVPIMANVTLGVGALTYAGQFNITVVADRDTCPDVDVFVHGMHDALQALAASLLVGEPSQPTLRPSLTR